MPTPFVSTCPHCETRLKLKDPALIGKKARCPACQESFVVEKSGDLASSPPPSKGPAKTAPPTRSKPKPKPEPQPELDPWLNDDLGAFDQDDELPRTSPGQMPPPVQGVRQKKASSSGKSSGKPSSGKSSGKKKSAGVSVEQVAWIGWIVGGGVAGLIGAGIWGAIAAFTFSEWGILAWGLGGFVGFGVRVAAREEDVGVAPGVVALTIAIASVVFGKFLAVHFMLASIEKMVQAAADGANPVEMTQDETVQWIISDRADVIAETWEEEGREIHWPDWENLPEDSTIKDEYPADVWAEAEKEWAALSPEQQTTEILEYKSGDMGFDGALGDAKGAIFAASFGILDLLWFFLAAATAFKVGSGLDFGDE